jgi:glucose/arabinose dehydrogenase
MIRRILILLALIGVAAGGVFAWLAWPDTAALPIEAVQGVRPNISQPRVQTIPTVAIAEPVGWGSARPTPAAGLQVQAFASGLDHPRWMHRLPNGDVLVAESNSPPRPKRGITSVVMGWLLGRAGAATPSANRITLLRDADGDGVAELKTPFMTGLNSPFGMALHKGSLYVANTDALVRVPYRDGQTRITARPELVVKLNGGENHWTRDVVASADGETLFVSVGSASNIAEKGLELERYRANLLQVWPADKNWRVYAAGLRNPVGVAINPVTRQPWTVVNERDMLGSDLVPDYLTQVELGDHFGWPWYYWGGYPDRRVEPSNPALQQYSKRPDYALGPHVAALGLTFTDGLRLGPRFASGAIIGEHGSWNRKPPSGYKVVYVPFNERGFPVRGAKPVDLLTGFLTADGKARGRPVGVTADKAGALLVADDVGNVIWRVSAGRQPATSG